MQVLMLVVHLMEALQHLITLSAPLPLRPLLLQYQEPISLQVRQAVLPIKTEYKQLSLGQISPLQQAVVLIMALVLWQSVEDQDLSLSTMQVEQEHTYSLVVTQLGVILPK
jgi:hypothetical protein